MPKAMEYCNESVPVPGHPLHQPRAALDRSSCVARLRSATVEGLRPRGRPARLRHWRREYPRGRAHPESALVLRARGNDSRVLIIVRSLRQPSFGAFTTQWDHYRLSVWDLKRLAEQYEAMVKLSITCQKLTMTPDVVFIKGFIDVGGCVAFKTVGKSHGAQYPAIV